MSTDHMPDEELEAIRNANARGAQTVQDRDRQLAADSRLVALAREEARIRAESEREQREALIAARLLLQRRRDEEAKLAKERAEVQASVSEEAGQMAFILSAAPAASASDPAAPAPNNGSSTQVLPPVIPGMASHDGDDTPVFVRWYHWARQRPWWWWIVAIVVGFLFWRIVYPWWPHWPVNGLHDAQKHVTHPTIRRVGSDVWGALHFAFGFFVGGLAAYRSESHLGGWMSRSRGWVVSRSRGRRKQ
ncbi:MAG: hypothetical protein WC498_00635 [Candidatus Saccharimonadales bacterium]